MARKQLMPAPKAGLVGRAFRLLRDPQARKLDKFVLLFWWLYDISPIDVLPDVFPPLTMVDDVGVTMWAAYLFLWASRRYKHQEALTRR